jgi:hypothetical protein
MACRVPLQAREVDIIKRMKRVLKLPIKQIARCVGRHTKTVYKALKTRTLLRRGRNEVLTTKQVRHLVFNSQVHGEVCPGSFRGDFGHSQEEGEGEGMREDSQEDHRDAVCGRQESEQHYQCTLRGLQWRDAHDAGDAADLPLSSNTQMATERGHCDVAMVYHDICYVV